MYLLLLLYGKGIQTHPSSGHFLHVPDSRQRLLLEERTGNLSRQSVPHLVGCYPITELCSNCKEWVAV